jgi:hypothetical protein
MIFKKDERAALRDVYKNKYTGRLADDMKKNAAAPPRLRKNKLKEVKI